jgi:hypothetical protein
MRNGLEERMHEYTREVGSRESDYLTLLPIPYSPFPYKETHPCNPKSLKNPPSRGCASIPT